MSKQSKEGAVDVKSDSQVVWKFQRVSNFTENSDDLIFMGLNGIYKLRELALIRMFDFI